jgi:pentatricopeptide repeat protein
MISILIYLCMINFYCGNGEERSADSVYNNLYFKSTDVLFDIHMLMQ